MRDIWIVAENAAWAATLVSAAKSLDQDCAITAFVRGDEAAAKDAVTYGAASAFALPLPAAGLWEDYAPALAEKAKADKPAFILISSSRRGRDLAAKTAALLDAPSFSDAAQLALSGDTFSCGTSVFGGTAVRTASTSAPVVIVTLGAKSYEPAAADASRSGAVATLPYSAGAAKVTERKPREKQSVNLPEATKVVGVGRGFSEEKDLAAARELAAAIGAEVGCSRPIAEFFKWMPEECYVGISGQVLKPQLYVAVGISGQAQHTFGVRDAKVIVSINKDEECLMHQNADYYIVGTWQDAIPAIIKAAKA
ncbi:MAG: electron transfer flavoprotein subunit alpha/FixB family protein [Desulfovibrio sp.]|jgi:electron transfer flavoprotein alpha subunit|nr:electron transfer flavoprotein subunit alpha/FixB family protein [Desulfovibrio sp.]